jgi:hypothetical protein
VTGGVRAAVLVAALVLTGLAGRPAVAQRPSAVRVGADNDAFSFWLPPWERTDRDYTSGVFGVVEYAGPAPWAWPQLAPDRPGTTHGYWIGQAIYTSDVEVVDGVAHARPDSRPNGAWLYLGLSSRDSTAARVREWRVQAGVVGPPAFGKPMQDFFHSLGHEYQRPNDWSSQLPAEPGAVLRFIQTRPHWVVGEPSSWNAGLSSSLDVSVGTILTGASAGARLWGALPEGLNTSQALVPRLVVGVEWTGHAVARDEFLDGTLFRESDHVRRIPFFDETAVSVGLRWRAVSATYRAMRTGRQYETQLQRSEWGSLTVEWRSGIGIRR